MSLIEISTYILVCVVMVVVERWWWLCLTTSVWGTNCAIHNRLRGQAIKLGPRTEKRGAAGGGRARENQPLMAIHPLPTSFAMS